MIAWLCLRENVIQGEVRAPDAMEAERLCHRWYPGCRVQSAISWRLAQQEPAPPPEPVVVKKDRTNRALYNWRRCAHAACGRIVRQPISGAGQDYCLSHRPTRAPTGRISR